MEAGLQVLAAQFADKFGFTYRRQRRILEVLVIDAEGHPLPQSTLEAAKKADAILLAAIGSPQYDNASVRPSTRFACSAQGA